MGTCLYSCPCTVLNAQRYAALISVCGRRCLRMLVHVLGMCSPASSSLQPPFLVGRAQADGAWRCPTSSKVLPKHEPGLQQHTRHIVLHLHCRVFLELQQEHGSFDAFVWGFVPDRQPIVNNWTQLSQIPTK